MKLTFIGAAHEVTGSCYLLEACGKNILIDCGLEQGRDVFVNKPIPISDREIDAVLLTHAHMDHAGRLPLLYKEGFQGNIHSTEATKELCGIMLLDSAHIQMFEAEWKNRKGIRKGEAPVEPLYTAEDVRGTLKTFVSHGYGEKISLFPEVEFQFTDSGHLLGSASIEIWVTEEGVTKKLVFSGDIGNINQPLINDPQYIKDADYVVMESTYGTRDHGAAPDYVKELTEILQATFDRGGNVVIPAFAVGRTQVLLYFIRQIKAENRIKGHKDFKVYVDSPLANEATEIFKENVHGYYDAQAMELVEKGINPIQFPGLVTAVSAEESKAINFDNDVKVIISASGMCDAGRIRHHLKHNLWRSECTVLFVGYQSEGTLGKILINGVDHVKLFGETIQVSAEIKRLNGSSGHADKTGLLKWINSYEKKPDTVFVTHGETESCESFAAALKEEYGFNSFAPFSGDCYDLKEGIWLEQNQGIRVKRGEEREEKKAASPVYGRLLDTANRLMTIIRQSDKRSAKDLAKLNDMLNSLIDKWR
ncbi:MBL fold metallo-hydrolase RNA specificity domain-containing protein [Anaerocolumna xylanovorans]|uniref:Metallo-beta-lactamase family protein n=1 Tax=Anaerocolumna xylanovorans DSM 12503 TaxID=1121345 RepID=A0A1M7YJ32_9FIRM|nr:MBL fold metallo-hydrolase [Anaerocolumna xylanovorans]SHO52591.1 metallo-beta-lactamase family protein [Anaerocolumna xylanovorans DSM 12503]